MILRVEKAMYGPIESAWLWYKELEKHLLSIGYTVSASDRASNIAFVHVDDIPSAATLNADGLLLEQEFWDSMENKWPGIKRHLSWNIHQDPATMKILHYGTGSSLWHLT